MSPVRAEHRAIDQDFGEEHRGDGDDVDRGHGDGGGQRDDDEGNGQFIRVSVRQRERGAVRESCRFRGDRGGRPTGKAGWRWCLRIESAARAAAAKVSSVAAGEFWRWLGVRLILKVRSARRCRPDGRRPSSGARSGTGKTDRRTPARSGSAAPSGSGSQACPGVWTSGAMPGVCRGTTS